MHAILLNQISDDSLLTLIQPAGDGNEEKRKCSDPLGSGQPITPNFAVARL